MNNLLAQVTIPLGQPFKGIGPLGLEGGRTGADAPFIFAAVITGAIGIMTVVAVIWFVIKLLIGAISIINAGGDKAKLESARNSILYGIIGLVVVISAIFVVDLFGFLLGLPNLLDIPKVVDTIYKLIK